ncbi:MAG TPA: right-handed parallel beta-helix repeat-containing protein [Gaiellaceae bacterium]|nr:right-handed parallel beta-helix repeat-containing protein [Gaiellaceae bacterium]
MRWVGAVVLAALALPPAALGHLERPVSFPDHLKGAVPPYRTTGPSVVVCKPDSRARIARLAPAARRRNAALLPSCRFSHVDAAVRAASSGTRILVLPGVYREEPSRAAPYDDPRCATLRPVYSTYELQQTCPNAENLVAIVGKRDIQIEGTGDDPSDVLFDGDRRKLNVIRADRADGVVLRNFTVQYSDFNNVYVIETNGFRLDRIVSRWSREYGFLSFSSDNGLYTDLVAHGSGDAGVYPGAGPQGLCQRYGIEIRRVDSYGNTLGYSGTSGDGIWVHDSRFHHNAAGLAMDSVFPNHPGMPQECSKFERNRIYSNNANLFSAQRDAYCKRPVLERDPKVVCPTTLVPVGTGLLIAGGNGNVVRGNQFYDNWRYGTMLFWVPAFIRGENDPALHYDTSHGNAFTGNRMGRRPGGVRAPNGVDFWWDEEGRANCWERNGQVRTDPVALPTCVAPRDFAPPRPDKFTQLVACAEWNPMTNTDPAGCNWPRRPSRPQP